MAKNPSVAGLDNRSALQLKRLLDLTISLSCLLMFSPLLLFISLVILISMGSPAIFRQRRVGYKGRPFMIYKFRTMTEEKDSDGNLLPDDQRLTPIGRLLRSLSMDELPELFNILRGEMSLVGPRPLLERYLDLYTTEQMRRHEVKPGITGWAQVNGRNALTWEEKFAHDLWYVDNQSQWLDLKILAMTIWMILKREGISQPSRATMEEFIGSQKE